MPANPVLQASISHLLTRPVGRPPNHVRRSYASFSYQARSWNRKRRVVAKVEWHPGELVPRVGFIVTNRSLPNERVLAFYNGRGTAEQHIKEGKYALKWTRLSCMRFSANVVRLQLHALAYNLANFLRTLAAPDEIETWSLTSLRETMDAYYERHRFAHVFAQAERAPERLAAKPGRLAADSTHPAAEPPRAAGGSTRQPNMSSKNPFFSVGAATSAAASVITVCSVV